ncbi:MAG: VWA domain-containing protein [Bryobacteraceae bacterium]|nr:VWA domain-containing protein [Bryobacteraceae bacterium]
MGTGDSIAGENKQQILVNVILDRSGSMQSSREGTIMGYNEYLKGLRADEATSYNVSLIQFDAPEERTDLTVCYLDTPLAEAPPLTARDYKPRGSTPLFDAIGECIHRVEAKGRPVLTVIITDGMENASREFTLEAVKALITEKEREGWRFVFLGANIDSYAVGGSLGVGAHSTANYMAGREEALYRSLAASSRNYARKIADLGLRKAMDAAFMDDSQKDELAGETSASPSTSQPVARKPRKRKKRPLVQ